ncbi:transcriptional regulator, DeoR family [Tropicibacter naphthalenivorans]|uniref:Glycerol-3-phosphate regulon repressor n=2 Tax=Tropicibacter naphthalenivorans TaxID=441103 RepID=A0A0P1GEQ8_9RHOB|nr:Glycerol-3-phosphate regulon repressor [Tropicibacter naphthalenivorans]SMC75019.1 transcriptional regulator, DeoR family [Tropicibacter naphthalenivorans]
MDRLVESGAVNLDDLAQRFSVSKMTIHRDLDELESDGLLRKIRGGATIEAGTRFESDFRFREMQGGEAKRCIAQAALDLVEPGMTVMINDGSTAAILGRGLLEKRPLTVITNNAAIIDALRDETGLTLIALGGVFSPKFNAFFGKVTEDALAGLRADIAFISTPAMAGTEVFHQEETVMRSKRAMMKSGAQTCLLVNHARFGHTALHKLADLTEFNSLITDQAPPPEVQAQLQEIKLPVIYR